MATFTATPTMALTSNATFQAMFGTFVDTQLQGLGGWTYVAQSGDIDPNTVAVPSAGSYAGFRVYSTTVGSTTWYVRLDFGREAGDKPTIKMKYGTTVNGSGTIGGQASTQIVTAFSGSPGASVYMSAAAGRLMLQFGTGTSNGTWVGFSLHGNVDNTGAMVSGMEHFTFGNGGNTVASQYVPASGTVPAAKAYLPCAFGTEASQLIGGVAMTGHPVFWDSTGANNPTLAVGEFPSTDFAAAFTTTVTLYGASIVFLVNGCFGISAGSANVSIGMRYQ